MAELPRQDDVHITDYLRVLVRRRYVGLLAFLTVFVSVSIHTFLAVPIYEASSTVQIKDASNKNILSELVQLDRTNPIAEEIEIIKSRTVAEDVVRRLKLDTVLISFPAGVGLEFSDLDVGRRMKGRVFTLTLDNESGDFTVASKDGELGRGRINEPFVANADKPDEYVKFRLGGGPAVPGVWFRFQQPMFRQAVANIQGNTDVRPVGDKTNILRVIYRDSNPDIARDVVNAVVETYRKRNIDENAAEARETLKFIESQREALQAGLEESEMRLRDFKAENNVMSLPDETTSMIHSYAEFAGERSKLEIEERHYASILGALDKSGPSDFSLPSVNRENTVLSNLALTLSDLQGKRQELVATFTEDHPDVKKIDDQIAELRGKIREVVKTTLMTIKARMAEIDDILQRYSDEMKTLPDKERSLAELVRAKEVNSEIYTFLLQKREEARITEAATIGNIRIIDEAQQPLRPISPNVRLNLMLGFVAGLLLAIGVAFFLEFIDDSLKSTEEVERFVKRPIYGMIPRIPDKRALEGGEPSPASANLVTHHSPKSPISEAFRTLRTNIHFANPDVPIRELLITSAGPSEGKSTIVSNLALTIANTGKKTIVIDCDLRKPNVHNFFDLARDPGVTTILSGEADWRDIVHPTQTENLFVLPSGPIPPNPTEMLSSHAMRELMETFRREFDMILLDSPPVVAVTDAAILSSFVHSTLLVVELGRSRGAGVNRAIDLLEKVNANLLGVITNSISTGYRYDYGGYHYYYYYADGEKKKRRKRRGGRYGYY